MALAIVINLLHLQPFIGISLLANSLKIYKFNVWKKSGLEGGLFKEFP